MKENYCVFNYNKLSKKWNIILKTPLLNDFHENKYKGKLLKSAYKLAKQYSVYCYIYDKENNLIEKRDYTKIK